MICKLLYVDFIKETIWEYGPDNAGELLIMVLGTLIVGILGLFIIPIDIILSPLYLLYWLLSKIRF